MINQLLLSTQYSQPGKFLPILKIDYTLVTLTLNDTTLPGI